jgi:hypothetical protein
MSAPDLTAELKEDLGITAADTTQDEWIERRVAGIWSRLEHATNRRLCIPPAKFMDDFTAIAGVDVWWVSPPAIASMPRTTVFLRQFPVVSIEALEVGTEDRDPTGVRFNPRTGRLLTLNDPVNIAIDVSREMLGTTKITYLAGWDEIPGDLYEIVLGAIQVQWAGRAGASGASGGLVGTVSEINVIDVGSIQMGAGNAFVQDAGKAGYVRDPLLGPYASMLDAYIDHRSGIGNQWMPVTTEIEDPPP